MTGTLLTAAVLGDIVSGVQNPYAPPPPQPGTTVPYYAGYGQQVGPYRDFDALVVPKFGQLAPACTKCGSPHVFAYPSKRFSFTPQWVLIAFFVSPLIGAILSAVMRKNAVFNVPLCQPCDREWKNGNRNLALSFIPGVATFLLGVALCMAELEDVGGPLIALSVLLLIAAPLIVQLAYRKKRTIWVRRIDDRAAWLMGVHPLAADAACARQQTVPMIPGGLPAMGGGPYNPPHLG